ncbi:hypothetical protein AaE_001099 [Aphanomyces astaci]|uniref:Uncharacterized protein n=1 Tax=Aphanomyces astaci TaxID=112090 RepID=A0A6A5B2S3_APHAT|nr:hypothetical protein AaE_001099 [Aphanomyces astaci]
MFHHYCNLSQQQQRDTLYSTSRRGYVTTSLSVTRTMLASQRQGFIVHVVSSHSVQNNLLHKQCAETIAQCSQSLQERRQQMAALSLPFTPLRKKSMTNSSSRDRYASPAPATSRLFDSTLSPIVPENCPPQPTPEPSCDVRKRLSFLDDAMDDDKTLDTVASVTTSGDLSAQSINASDASLNDSKAEGTML